MKSSSSHIRHVHRHGGFSYPISLPQRIYTLVIGPILMVVVLFLVISIFSRIDVSQTISIHELVFASLATLSRLLIAYILSVIFSIPLAILATSSPLLETIFLPVFDILESVPILAFLPVLVVIFINFNLPNTAAVLILFLSMVWSIVFTVVGGLKIIPKDIKYAAQIFHVTGFSYFRKVILPAIFPEFITGSILALAAGWNLIIIAEVLHTYIPNGTTKQDLFGLGSILVHAGSSGQTKLFIVALGALVLMIAFINFFIWQKLLHYAQRFRFE